MANNILQTIINAVMSLIQQKLQDGPAPVAPAPAPIAPPEINVLDWTNPESMVSKYFSVNNCLLLHAWNRLATTEDGYDPNQLIALCTKLDEIREILGFPMNVHSLFRSQAYNQSQGLKPLADVHSLSEAVDFDASPNLSTDEVKARLMPLLEQMGLRMEDNGPGASWVHLDIHPVGHARFFKP